MIFLPIVGRELRVAARRTGTYRTRLWAALGAMLLAGWKALDLAWKGASPVTQGQSLFYTLASLAFVYCLFIGARTTADCVSEEKREGTLGLLFLTDLRGFDVILGKLVASSLNAFYGLLAVLPLLAMPLLLGGVTLMQFAKMVLVLINALLFSLGVGIFVSTVSRNERKAMLGTLLAVISPAAVPFCAIFFMVAVAEWIQDPSELIPWLPTLILNPIYPFILLLPVPWPPLLPIPAWSFWVSLAVVQLGTWIVLVGASWLLPRIWRDRIRPVATQESRGWRDWGQIWTRGSPKTRAALRTRLMDRNPYLWLVSRDRFKPAYAWFFVGSMVAVWSWGYFKHREVMFDFYPLVPTLILIHAFLKIWVASEVSHRLVEDQRHGALELLLSTPLKLEGLLRGQEMAAWRQFSGPVLTLCAIELVVLRANYAVSEILLVLGILLADLFTLLWVALRLSLVARSMNELLLKSFFWVMLLPWVIFGLTWPACATTVRWAIRWAMHERWHPVFPHRLYWWFLVALLTDLVLVWWARPQLMAPSRRASRSQPGRNATSKSKWLGWCLEPES